MKARIPVRGMGLLGLLFSVGCGGPQYRVAERAEDIRPIQVGEALPKIVLRTAENRAFDLNAAVAEKPTVLIYYRGGWCPFCNAHLGKLQAIERELLEMGFQILAVSPDRPELLKAAAAKQKLEYRLLSDSEMLGAQALGIAFQLDEATVRKYKTEYKIDIEADSGQTHHLLPVPAALVVGRDGVVRYAYVNANYKVRVEPEVLLEAAEKAL